MVKDTSGIISDGGCWKPGQLFLSTQNNFPIISFRLGAGTKNTKMAIFMRCLEIAGK